MRGGGEREGPTTYHDELDGRVEHALTTLALANTMEASAGEPRKGVWRGVGVQRGEGPWGRRGAGGTDPCVECCLCPARTQSCPLLSSRKLSQH